MQVYFFHQIGEVFLHYLFKYILNFLLLLFSFWHLYNSDIGTFQVVPEIPQSRFIFFEFLSFHSVPVGCLFLPFVSNCCFFPVTVSSLNILIYFISGIFFYFFFICQASSISSVSILITRALNSPSDRLAISSLLSSVSEVLLRSFIWALFLCLQAPV